MIHACISSLLLSLPSGVSSHGMLTKPVSRSIFLATGDPNGLAVAGTCPMKACQWYNQDKAIPGKPTNCDPKLRTMGSYCTKAPIDWTCAQKSPWCAPGTAPVLSSCGIYSGGWNSDGRDMRDLPGEPKEVWEAGSTQEVAWSVTANHGGGYSYRLCRADSDLSEECFQANQLDFVGNKSRIVNTKGETVSVIDAIRTSAGTFPVGSQWTRNPFPMEQNIGSLIPGLPNQYGRGPFGFSIVDQVKIPADLPAGHYVLSWRWDAEQTKQVWVQCSDVEIRSSVPPPQPPGPQYIPKTKHVCVGTSLGLSVYDCDAWVEFFDTLNGPHWPRDNATCPNPRLDPCGCGGVWASQVVCSTKRDYRRITEIYVLGPEVKGQIPSSIGKFSELVAISLVRTNITGKLPDNIGNLPLEMIWFDHNAYLGGPIPKSLEKLKSIAALEMHRSNFSGVLPDLDYANIPDCTLEDNKFACPLPKGAEICGATCA